MNNIFSTFSIFVILLFGSCQDNDPNHIAQNKIRDELMAVHDEVMPKMGQINKLRKQLISLTKNKIIKDSTSIEAINYTIKYLEKADEGMMDWMGEFQQPSKMRGEKSHEEIIAYLIGEKGIIQKVKDDILGSIEAASKIIEAHEAAE